VSDKFPIRNGLKQGDALSPEHPIRRVQVNQNGLKLNGTHQLLAYAVDVNILGGSIHTLKENAEALVAATREIGLEVSADKTKYMVMSRDQNGVRSHRIKTDNSSPERVEPFRYLGTILTNYVQKEIKSRLKSGNACHHSVQNLLSSILLSKNLKIKIYRAIILPFVLHGYKTWSLTWMEERRLRMFENRVLRGIFWPKKEWRKLHNEELNELYSSPNVFRVVKSRIMRWAGHVTRMVERRGVYRGLVGKPEGKRQLGRTRRRWEDNIKVGLQEVGFGVDRAG